MNTGKSIIKSKWFLIAAAILGAALLIAGRFAFSGKEKNTEKEEPDATVEYYSERLEEKIAELVSRVSGAGEVSVLVTLDCSDEYVYAQNTRTSDGQSAVDYLVLSGSEGEDGLPVSRIYPKVRGVAIVSSGASDISVKKEITELVAAALGISSSKIMVSY